MSESYRPGCCVDGSCKPNFVGGLEDESDCMRLPMGVRCEHCAHIGKCAAMFGKKPNDDTCDFFPRRFLRPMPDSTIYLSCPRCPARSERDGFHTRGQFCLCGWRRDAESNPIYSAAIDYVFIRGWSVLPVLPDKRPAIGSWKFLTKQRPDQELLELWFDDDNPPGIGVICGRISNLIVLDIESHAVSGFREVPATLSAISQRHGVHYYYQFNERPHPGIVKLNGKRAGDIKGEGSYVVAPPTRGTRGGYRWLSLDPIAPAPDWLFSMPVLHPTLCPPSGELSSAAVPVHHRYDSRSERLMAIARKVVSAGGTVADLRKAYLADPAGSKLMENPRGIDKFVERDFSKVSTTLPGVSGEVVTATIRSIGKGRVGGQRLRITLKLDLPDGRVIREGVTMIDGSERADAFRAALPNPRTGQTVLLEIYETEFRGRPRWRVRRFLAAKGEQP